MMTSTTDTMQLDADDILAWLKAHPNFLQKHPEACEYLLPPKEYTGKGVADFQAHMVQRLKRDKEDMLNTTREIVEVSRINMNSVTRIHDATLKLLEARSFVEFIETVTHDIAAILDVDVAVLVVEAPQGVDVPRLEDSGVRIVPQGAIQHWMQDNLSILESDMVGIEEIYGAAARLVRSQAVLRVDISKLTPPAMLAFGSRDPEMFGQGQGTELISYLARVVERSFRLWLDLPPA